MSLMRQCQARPVSVQGRGVVHLLVKIGLDLHLLPCPFPFPLEGATIQRQI